MRSERRGKKAGHRAPGHARAKRGQSSRAAERAIHICRVGPGEERPHRRGLDSCAPRSLCQPTEPLVRSETIARIMAAVTPNAQIVAIVASSRNPLELSLGND